MNEVELEYQIGSFENNKLIGERYLSVEEYVEFKESRNCLRRCIHAIDMFNLVVNNYNELIDYCEKEVEAIQEAEYGTSIRATRIVYVQVNRLLLNYLSMVKSFLDFYETDVKRAYGVDSLQAEVLRAIKALCFDNCFAYRFFYKLRNYAQHIDLPLNEVRLKSKRVSKERMQRHLIFGFNKQTLLDQYTDWGIIVKKDLEEMNIEIDLFNMLEDHIACIKRIYREVARLRNPEIFRATEFLNNLTKEYRERYKSICVFKSKAIYNNEKISGENIELEFIDLNQIDYFIMESEKNS